MVKTRDTYHHGDLRRALVDAASRLIEVKGVHGFSLREAAREAGVSPSAPYRHFKDRAALLTAVAEEAAELLFDEIERRVAQAGPDPLQQYRATGIAHVTFAVKHPAYFRVIHDPELSDTTNAPLLARLKERNDGLIQGALTAAHEQGRTRRARSAVELTATTLIYGLARRIIDGHFGAITLEQAEELAILTTDLLGSGIARAHHPRQAEPGADVTPAET